MSASIRKVTRGSHLASPVSKGDLAPKATGCSRDYIDHLAGDISKKLGYKPGDDLEILVKALGGEIKVHPWQEPCHDGSIEVRGFGDFTICLSPFTSELRDRFTIAHELGHYFLHSLVGSKKINIAREGSNPVEWEANWFATGFLVPSSSFKKAFDECGGDIWQLAARFKVSSQTIQLRIKELNLGLQTSHH